MTKHGDELLKRIEHFTGKEILYELICHLKWEEDWEAIKADVVNVIPCYMPYIDIQFQPCAMSDRPQVVQKEVRILR